MKQPVEPRKEDCCNSGCNPCIFDVYEQQLKQYKKFLDCGETSSQIISENAISPLEYTKFCLVKTETVCEQHILLWFKSIQSDSGSKKVSWKPGDHLLLKFSGSTSCTRAYTPFKVDNSHSDFTIIVKVYANGLVSNYLNNLRLGEVTLWRGPYGNYNLIPNKFDRIIMIAQGTGIAPFISIIENILCNEDDMTKIILYSCVKNEKTILLRDTLYSYRQYWNFTYKIFCSASSDCAKYKYQEPIVPHKLGVDDITCLRPFLLNDEQFLICGSSQFMADLELLLHNQKISLKNIVKFCSDFYFLSGLLSKFTVQVLSFEEEQREGGCKVESTNKPCYNELAHSCMAFT